METENEKSGKRYYKLQLTALEKLPRPIVSGRQRRVLFLATTFDQLLQAMELKDLVNSSSKLYNPD
jgi:hypothetical protein